MQPSYPLYIVSKGRWESRLTHKALQSMGVPHYMIVEEHEANHYAAAIGNMATLLVLDRAYQRDYETCDDLGLTKSPGPGAARNFAWDHAISHGYTWHWVMDDNIYYFIRLARNHFWIQTDGTAFYCMEEFAGRYTNVAMAGPQYFKFVARKAPKPPLTLNTRVYSCNLIRNDLPYRWRGRYNEDTDLSLRMLKDGWCTIQFNAFLQEKVTTQRILGGNNADFYAVEGTLPKSEMLKKLHPDVTRVLWRFNRWHHYVDYSRFRRNRLQRRPGLVIPQEPNEYGMVFQVVSDGR